MNDKLFGLPIDRCLSICLWMMMMMIVDGQMQDRVHVEVTLFTRIICMVHTICSNLKASKDIDVSFMPSRSSRAFLLFDIFPVWGLYLVILY